MKSYTHTQRKGHMLLLSTGILAAAALFYIFAVNGIGLPCFFHKITGLLCPGCGNSRAAVALLSLDIEGALSYNLLFPLEFFYLAWVYLHGVKHYIRTGVFSYKPLWVIMDVTVLVAILGWGIIRNIM